MAKKITKKAMALIMSAMILITATPVFAASTGSVASDPNIGEDTVQSAKTEYDEVGEGNTSTNVYLTVDNSDVLVGVPTSIILSGTPDNEGNYTGEYSVKASGDISGDQSVMVEPKEETVSLVQKGKDNTSATITQEKTIFTSAELSEGATTTGKVTANGLTAGSWSGSATFEIGINSIVDNSIVNTVLGNNAKRFGASAKINTDHSLSLNFTEARLYDIYAIPISILGLQVGDKITIKNEGTENYMMSVDTLNSSWNNLNVSSGWTLDQQETSLVIPENCFALSFVVEKLKAGTDTADTNRIDFDIDSIPLNEFIWTSDKKPINYISVLSRMVREQNGSLISNKINLHNADADWIDNLTDALNTHRINIMDVDLRKTSDGIWVNLHDNIFKGLTVSSTTYEELKRVDNTDSIKTFNELLVYAKENKIILQVEDKITSMRSQENIQELYSIIDELDANDLVYFSSDSGNNLLNNVTTCKDDSNVMIYDVWGGACSNEQAELIFEKTKNTILNTTFNYHTTLSNEEIKTYSDKGYKIEIGFNHTANDMGSYYQNLNSVWQNMSNIFSIKVDLNAYEYLVAAYWYCKNV